MSEYVSIEHPSYSRPVYHSVDHSGAGNWNVGDGISYREWVNDWYEKARCGAKLTLCATFIQRDRADLFARPCKRCFR